MYDIQYIQGVDIKIRRSKGIASLANKLGYYNSIFIFISKKQVTSINKYQQYYKNINLRLMINIWN